MVATTLAQIAQRFSSTVAGGGNAAANTAKGTSEAARYTLSEVRKMCPFMKNCGSKLTSSHLEKHANFCPVVSHLQVPLKISNDEAGDGSVAEMAASKGKGSAASNATVAEGLPAAAKSQCPFGFGAGAADVSAATAAPTGTATEANTSSTGGLSIPSLSELSKRFMGVGVDANSPKNHPEISQEKAQELREKLGDTAKKCPFFANLVDLKERSYEHKFFTAIQKLHSEGRYRSFANLQRECGNFPMAKFRPPSVSSGAVEIDLER